MSAAEAGRDPLGLFRRCRAFGRLYGIAASLGVLGAHLGGLDLVPFALAAAGMWLAEGAMWSAVVRVERRNRRAFGETCAIDEHEDSDPPPASNPGMLCADSRPWPAHISRRRHGVQHGAIQSDSCAAAPTSNPKKGEDPSPFFKR